MNNNKCELCGSKLRLEEHHEIPRAYGGHDSTLHILCVGCHDFIHDMAVAIKGKVRRSVSDFMLAQWASELKPEIDKDAAVKQARYLVAQIVKAALLNRDADFDLQDNPQTVQIEMPRWLRAVIKRVAKDKQITVNMYIVNTLKKEVQNEGFSIADKTNTVTKPQAFNL